MKKVNRLVDRFGSVWFGHWGMPFLWYGDGGGIGERERERNEVVRVFGYRRRDYRIEGERGKRERVVIYLAFQLNLLVICIWNIPLRKPRFASIQQHN